MCRRDRWQSIPGCNQSVREPAERVCTLQYGGPSLRNAREPVKPFSDPLHRDPDPDPHRNIGERRVRFHFCGRRRDIDPLPDLKARKPAMLPRKEPVLAARDAQTVQRSAETRSGPSFTIRTTNFGVSKGRGLLTTILYEPGRRLPRKLLDASRLEL
jgi:hypothetical protein